MRHTVTSELDPDLFDELERERNSGGISRSAAIRQAVEWWIVQRKEHGEERISRTLANHRQLMNRLDYIVGMIREQDRMAGRLEEYESRRRQSSSQQAPPQDAPKESAVAGDGQKSEPLREQLQEPQEPQPRIEPELENSPERAELEEPEGSPRQGALSEARKRARRKLG